MITYPIVLKAQGQSEPQGIIHTFTIEEGDTESSSNDGFEHISIWMENQWSSDATYTCAYCGTILEMPDGSLKAHLKKYQEEHAGQDAIVRTLHAHNGPASTDHLNLRKRTNVDKTE